MLIRQFRHSCSETIDHDYPRTSALKSSLPLWLCDPCLSPPAPAAALLLPIFPQTPAPFWRQGLIPSFTLPLAKHNNGQCFINSEAQCHRLRRRDLRRHRHRDRRRLCHEELRLTVSLSLPSELGDRRVGFGLKFCQAFIFSFQDLNVGDFATWRQHQRTKLGRIWKEEKKRTYE